MVRLGGVMTWVRLAVFVALGCNPVVRGLIRHGLSRSQAVPVVVAGGGLLLAGAVALVIPTVLAQMRKLIADAPQLVASIGDQAWLGHLQSLLPIGVNVEVLLEQGQHALTRPAVLEKLTSGAVSTGIGVFGTVSAIVTIGVLALCLLATLPQVGAGMLALVPARSRTLVTSLVPKSPSQPAGTSAGCSCWRR
ncbi:AI-2E family transporter [Curtobacterium sp. A7_M15]|uniref:AI-2E family transporter n=1 Tax=Curtobacterium sp. A7_M15 TaxID=3065241 RepID=UPI003520C5FF